MTERDEQAGKEAEMARVERALCGTLRVRPLPPEAMDRIRSTVEAQWKTSAASAGAATNRRELRWGRWMSLAAAVLLITLTAVVYLRPAGPTYEFGTVARVDFGAAEVRHGYFSAQALKTGDRLKTHAVLETRGPTLIALLDGGTLRVAADTSLELTGPTAAVLHRGQIYVDLPPGTPTKAPFQIETRAGVIEHVGTEFEVISNDRLVRVRVREGSVRLKSPSQDLTANAGTELTALNDGTVSRAAISTYGRDWLWVAALAPDYEIEGKPLLGFLEWAGRELGRPIKFSDDRARMVAQQTILHGSVRGREPLDALASVLATTSLTYEMRSDAIWIQSGHAN